VKIYNIHAVCQTLATRKLYNVVFLNCCVLSYVAELGELYPPVIITITDTRVTLSIKRPSGIIASKVLKYAIQYRKAGSSDWDSTTERTSLMRTVTCLDPNSLYWFRVVAKYQGESSSVQSRATRARTRKRKRILD